MTITTHHTQACFEAWVKCENLLMQISEAGISFSKKFTQLLEECATVCMGTFNALKSEAENLNDIALLCVGICEECAEVCETQDNLLLQECAQVCRNCSNTISPIAFNSSYVYVSS
jgi:hypothetical protein